MEKKRNGYQEFMDFIDSLIKQLLILMLLCLVLCVLLQVVGRYIPFIKPFSWTEEIARWLLVWLSFLGATHIAKSSSYIRVDFFVNIMPAGMKRIVSCISKLIMLAFTGWFAYKSFVVFTTVSIHEVGPTTQLPMLLVRSSMFIGMAITFLQMISAGGIMLLNPEEEASSV